VSGVGMGWSDSWHASVGRGEDQDAPPHGVDEFSSCAAPPVAVPALAVPHQGWEVGHLAVFGVKSDASQPGSTALGLLPQPVLIGALRDQVQGRVAGSARGQHMLLGSQALVKVRVHFLTRWRCGCGMHPTGLSPVHSARAGANDRRTSEKHASRDAAQGCGAHI